VLLIDDGNPDGTEGWTPFSPKCLTDISTLVLRSNVGHQRAICIGLCYIYESSACDLVIVMDIDGEDRPEDALILAKRLVSSKEAICFGARRKRAVGWSFRIGYFMFRSLHRMLTGVSINVGNFSALRFSVLSRLTVVSELWTHYSGAVLKSRVAFESVPLDRGRG
jgi:polyisoprenyl-phosphate glycosyltransferase